MIEDSVENFISRWRTYAAEVELFSHTEGYPLLECRAGGTIFHVFERTGPYLANPGSAQLIINPVAETLVTAQDVKSLSMTGLSQVKGSGLLLERQDEIVVIDVGVPVVVAVYAEIPDKAVVGSYVSFESLAPVHGFLVPQLRRYEGDMASADERL